MQVAQYTYPLNKRAKSRTPDGIGMLLHTTHFALQQRQAAARTQWAAHAQPHNLLTAMQVYAAQLDNSGRQ